MRTILLAAVAAMLPAYASAADIQSALMSNGGTVVYVTGVFAPGDGNVFAQSTASLSRVLVSFHSPGGNAVAGIQIGRVIHQRGYTTYVGAGSRCESACAVAWLGGAHRNASAQGQIGFHAAYNGSGADARESGAANALVGAYLAEIGITSDAAIAYFTHARPNDMQLFSFNDARVLGIAVQQQEWAQTAAALASQPTYASTQPAYSQPAAPPEPQQPSYAPQYDAPPVYPPVLYAPAPFYRGYGMPRYAVPMRGGYYRRR